MTLIPVSVDVRVSRISRHLAALKDYDGQTAGAGGQFIDPHKSKMMELRGENVSTSNQCRRKILNL